MVDSTTALTFVSIIGGAIIAGIGGAMGWFRLQRNGLIKTFTDVKQSMEKTIEDIKKTVNENNNKLWEEMTCRREEASEQAGDIKVLHEQVSNNLRTLDQIYDNTEQCRQQISGLSDNFTKLLIEIRTQRGGTR